MSFLVQMEKITISVAKKAQVSCPRKKLKPQKIHPLSLPLEIVQLKGLHPELYDMPSTAPTKVSNHFLNELVVLWGLSGDG